MVIIFRKKEYTIWLKISIFFPGSKNLQNEDEPKAVTQAKTAGKFFSIGQNGG